jgi:5-methylcytosine-specific restriction enzyme B
VALPPAASYRSLFASACADVDEPAREQIVDAGMKLAFGRRQLGPAILLDIARFVRMGLTQTVSGQPYADPVEAFLAAVRLYAVPQYEGAWASEIEDAKSRLRGVWSDPPEQAWNALSAGLDAVALS